MPVRNDPPYILLVWGTITHIFDTKIHRSKQDFVDVIHNRITTIEYSFMNTMYFMLTTSSDYNLESVRT